MIFKIFLAMIFVLNCSVAFAVDFYNSRQTKGTLRAEYTAGNGLEQLTIIFEANKIIMVSNSNFLNPSRKVVHLGVFEGAFDEAAKSDHHGFGQLKNRMKNVDEVNTNKKRTITPHVIRLFIDNIEIHNDSIYYQGLLNRLNEIVGNTQWYPKDVARVELGDSRKTAKVKVLGRHVLSKLSNNTEVQCQVTSGNKRSCKVSNFGIAYFQ